jgi:sortase (surface protein transpeptidase)
VPRPLDRRSFLTAALPLGAAAAGAPGLAGGAPPAGGGRGAAPAPPASAGVIAVPTEDVQTYTAGGKLKPRVDYMELPLHLRIPGLAVDAPVIAVGLTADKAMDVPQRAEDVGWYEYSSRPGTKGNSVLAGHLDWLGAPGVFRRLIDLRPGDAVAVRGADGEERSFAVEWNREWQLGKAPITTIFEPLDRPALTLITCGGRWNPTTRLYDTRVVVRALR